MRGERDDHIAAVTVLEAEDAMTRGGGAGVERRDDGCKRGGRGRRLLESALECDGARGDESEESGQVVVIHGGEQRRRQIVLEVAYLPS